MSKNQSLKKALTAHPKNLPLKPQILKQVVVASRMGKTSSKSSLHALENPQKIFHPVFKQIINRSIKFSPRERNFFYFILQLKSFFTIKFIH